MNWVPVFSAYQKSGMNNVKWTLMDHNADDTLWNCGLFLCDACLYEHSNSIFKKSYAKSKNRKSHEMDYSIVGGSRRSSGDVRTTHGSDRHIGPWTEYRKHE